MRIVAALFAASLVAACSKTAPPPPPGPALRTVDVGAHRVEVRLADPSQVMLVDFGPASPKGMQAELLAARELWRSGDRETAKKRLLAVPVDPGLLPSLAAPSPFASARSRLLYPPGNMTPDDAEGCFATLAAGLETAPPPSLQAVVEWAVPRFDGTRIVDIRRTSGGPYDGQEYDAMAGRQDARRRDVVARTPLTVGGLAAIEVETRENLTNARKRRMTFVAHADRLLVIASPSGYDGASLAAYEAARDSLAFRD